MKKTAVLMYPSFSEYEISVALSVLGQAGKEVVTVSDTDDPVVGEACFACLPDATYDEINPDDFDSVLLPGMMQLLPEETEAKCVAFLRAMGERENLIGAVSLSPYLLAKAGLLEGRLYTVGMYEEDMDEMGVFDKANLVKEPVVEDGLLITAVGSGFVGFGLAFGRALGLSFDGTWYE